MSPDIARILEAGNRAPSGENSQPWHFVVDGSRIEVHLLAERNRSYYGWGQRASYIANGAVIENICIAASELGYRADVSYFPSSEDPYFVASIRLAKNVSVTPDPLCPCIEKRVSNRKRYAIDQLSKEACSALQSETRDPNCSFVLIGSRPQIQRLSRVGSANEEVMLANRELHAFFFSHLNWTKKEDDEKKIGFYIPTLELPAPAVASFHVLRHWNVMRVLKAIRFQKLIGKQNAQTYASSAAIGAILLENEEPLDYVKAGRALERLWLRATALGLSIQPLTGILFFKLKIEHEDDGAFNEKERRFIENEYKATESIFGSQGKRIAFMFRIGNADAPSARASRFPLAEVVTVR